MVESINIKGLLKAFKTLGGDENGCIDYDKIALSLRKKLGISESEVACLLEKDNCCRDGKLDFLKLCTKIVTTKIAFDRLAPEGSLPADRKINSRTFTRRKGSLRPSSGTSKGKKCEHSEIQLPQKASLKGCLFDTESPAVLCGHRYHLTIDENSPIEIVAAAANLEGNPSPLPAIEVLLFLENEEPNKKLVTFSSFINSEGYCAIRMNLKKGKYLLVPVTLSWKGQDKETDVEEMEPLTDYNENGEFVLSSACCQALKTIFDLIDLNSNNFLSQMEFDLFIQHICGEASSDEWSTVVDNFDTVDGELTFDGFLSLYKMAVVTDSQDVGHMFNKMGLSNSLHLKQALPFSISVSAKATLPKLQPMPICIFDSLMEEVFRKTAMEQGDCNKIKNMNDLLLYTHKLPHRVTVVVCNQSHSKTKVRLDCTNSVNCISHQGALDFTVEVHPRSSIIGHHLFPDKCGEPWSIQCIEALVE